MSDIELLNKHVTSLDTYIRGAIYAAFDAFTASLDYHQVPLSDLVHRTPQAYQQVFDEASLDKIELRLSFDRGWIVAPVTSLNYLYDIRVSLPFKLTAEDMRDTNFTEAIGEQFTRCSRSRYISAGFADPTNARLEHLKIYANQTMLTLAYVKDGYIRRNWRRTRYFSNIADFARTYLEHRAAMSKGLTKRDTKVKSLRQAALEHNRIQLAAISMNSLDYHNPYSIHQVMSCGCWPAEAPISKSLKEALKPYSSYNEHHVIITDT